ncbi:extracellular calcium-sensing receptor-like [Brienomyrus brachyistius]|uniref:extracellular calcium-sensing receptor-like n=1 Tax=Brienomyrus brachyistius TaxID=42636 RepID=UPI0020B444F5|nr:extracellular calcium-sensing receptor-like [Brienomyrus brachyistius]
MRLFGVILFALLTRAQNPTCKLVGNAEVPDLSKDGDFIIGGVFSFDNINTKDNFEFTVQPTFSKCIRKNYREYKLARTMVFTIEEINRNNKLLPGVTLGYRIYNACGNIQILSAVFTAVSGPDDCSNTRVQALIGCSSSGPSSIVSKAISPLHIPMNCAQ